jgi:D-arabinose 1-dehydrogenase-like Zn-dependent alcohol dehydrogenase
MKAAVVTAFDRPLSIEDVPRPVPDAEQVLLRIEASGLCHTDIHAARASGRSSPRRRSRPATRASASSTSSVRATCWA